jgi:hypothetical protein
MIRAGTRLPAIDLGARALLSIEHGNGGGCKYLLFMKNMLDSNGFLMGSETVYLYQYETGVLPFMKIFTLLTTSIACTVALAACGGGDNDTVTPVAGSGTSTGTGTNTGGNSSTPTPVPLVFSYEALPVAADANSFLALINSEGARGYRYLSDKTFSDGTKSIFLNDSTAPSYICEMQTPYTDYTTQANAEGARGYFAFSGDGGESYFLDYNFYCQAGGVGAQYTYSYTSDVVPSSAPDFLNQLNKWGQSGYYINGQVYDINTDLVLQTSYEQNTISRPTYIYDLQTPPTNVNDYLAQLNSEGAQGYRGERINLGLNYAPYDVINDGIETMIYMKDQSQSATFSYITDTPPTTSADFIAQANGHGAQNYGYIGELTFAGQPISFYFKANNCVGFICAGLTWDAN